ncbi:MAG: hypothetical protein IT372_01245 [Polyangiaceae bacterium]|nr:hypothetical protein [Polyangiaceae bacterium]
MNVYRGVFLAAALLSLVACKKDDDSDLPPPAPTAPPTTVVAPTPVPSQPTDLKVEEPGAKIEARVRSELDGRADGITGSPLAVAGAKASLQSPSGWQTTRGDLTVVASPDKKAQIAAGAFGAEGPTGKLAAATSALGLASCQWNAPESLTVGASKLAATAADGVCTRGAAKVRTAYVAPQAEGLLVVGGWDPDGDSAGVFGSMRSITKAAGGTGDASGIAACCAALRQNAKSAPPDQQGALIAAAGMCDAVRNNPQGRAALAQVRALLAGANVPATCR